VRNSLMSGRGLLEPAMQRLDGCQRHVFRRRILAASSTSHPALAFDHKGQVLWDFVESV